MMRDFKFRAWDKRDKKMLSWWDINDRCNFQSMLYEFADNKQHYNVMQYTGLKDKNGVEIYEGDIIREHPWDEYLYAEVVFEKGIFKGKECGYEAEYPIYDWAKGEVIGNIYENKELLEGEN